MNRKNFIKNCGFACVGGAGMAALFESCSSTKLLNGKIAGDDIIISVADFETKNGKNIYFHLLS